jgi:hypothetical protein
MAYPCLLSHSGVEDGHREFTGAERKRMNLDSGALPGAELWQFKNRYLFVSANIARAYWRSGFPPSEALVNTLMAFLWNKNTCRFARAHGYLPNYANPRSFAEKIQWRKLFDRNPLFPILSDKIAVRDYVASRAPRVGFPSIFWTGTNPDAIPFDKLLPPFVIKPNNRSGSIIIVRDYQEFDRITIVREIHRWMKEPPFGQNTGQWFYREVPTKIIVEEFLSDRDSVAPAAEVKVFVFHGVASFLYYTYGRHSSHERVRGLYTREWQQVPVDRWTSRGRVLFQGGAPRPQGLSNLLATAEAIAAEIDHLRVDFYIIDESLYFGEATVCDHSGFQTWLPKDASSDSPPSRSFGDSVGELWKLARLSRWEQLKRILLPGCTVNRPGNAEAPTLERKEP